MGREDIEISDEAVRRATGRTWDEWEEAIDGWGGPELTHQEIVALVRERGGVESGWWQQGVTNGYEKMKGRRTTGETQDAAFQIGVSRTLDVPAARVWNALRSPKGLREWLGDAKDLSLEAGATYATLEGAVGEVRVVSSKHLRLTWHPEGWTKSSTIQVRVDPKGPDRCVVTFHQEKIPDAEEREARRSWFRKALDALEAMVAG